MVSYQQEVSDISSSRVEKMQECRNTTLDLEAKKKVSHYLIKF